MHIVDHDPAAACLSPEPEATMVQPLAAGQSTGPNDPGEKLYAERSVFLAGLFMPPALPWEDLPEQDKTRWRRYAAARG